MSASFNEIKRWLKVAQEKKATHLIVAVDKYDYDNYPVFVIDKPIKEEYDRINNSDMQGVDEVYNMSMGIEGQLNERRAFNM